ncbi:hypothetical protein [Pseudobacillus badius]|uniref:hypothetical protein n=1 Tax=Bacillus badius TaxID=1455 RepID=UPI000AE6DC5E|nr:hypothetical protein [Bacillus badius]
MRISVNSKKIVRKEMIERVFADAYFRCDDSQVNGQLDLAGPENGFEMILFRIPFVDKLKSLQ